MNKYQNEMEVTLMEVTLMEGKLALRGLRIDELEAKTSRLERAMEAAMEELEDRSKYSGDPTSNPAKEAIDKIKQILSGGEG